MILLNNSDISTSERYIAAICAFFAGSVSLGCVHISNIYLFIVLLLWATFSIISGKRIHGFPIFFLFGCAIGTMISQPLPLFRSWERFGLFCILIIATLPVFGSVKFFRFRKQVLCYALIFCTIVGASSLICYLLGINYMSRGGEIISIEHVGGFGGLCNHSMTLGPIAAIGSIYALNMMYANNLKKIIRILCFTISMMCLCCVMISGSRSSFLAMLVGIIYVLSYKHSKRFVSIVKIISVIVFLTVAAYPIYAPFMQRVIEKQIINNKMGSVAASRSDRWEHRLVEFYENPISGVGFASIAPKYNKEYVPKTGTVESGSSWLAVVSMTGLLGAIPFCCLLVKAIMKIRYGLKKRDQDALLISSILVIFAVHFCAEGYIFGVGAFQCFLFWLTLGNALECKELQIKVRMETPRAMINA